MISVTVNGERRSVPEGASVAELLELLDVPTSGRGVAVAVDGEVVPRSRWAASTLLDGARIEVLVAVQGG